MDLLGDIVEHDIEENPQAPEPIDFKPQTALKPSQWKQRLQKKGLESMSGLVKPNQRVDDGKFYTQDEQTGLKSFKNAKDRKLDYSGLDEKAQIHQENIEILSRMSLEEREEAKQELLDTLDPAILQMLMNRANRGKNSTEKPSAQHQSSDEPVEGALGTWVGGEHPDDLKESAQKAKEEPEKEAETNNRPKTIRFDSKARVVHINQALKVEDVPKADEDDEWEDYEDLHPVDIDDAKHASDSHVIKEAQVHFPKPCEPFEHLDINDPHFNEKLHEKYFPDLPQNVSKLDWMKPTVEAPVNVEYESIMDVRFDFKGDIINSQNIEELNKQNTGLHNHSANPELPGYTLSELGHLLRSTFPGQCCIAARTLGRIMYKLGKLEYQIQEHIDETDEQGKINDQGQIGQFEVESWKLINNLQILDLLHHLSSDNQKNLSIKNYAIDALWLWKQGGGNSPELKKLIESQSQSQTEN